MEQYNNISGNSGISGYENASDRITVVFDNGQSYTWSYQSAGREAVEQMKALAQAGSGLHGFINSNVKYQYEQ